MASNIRTGQTTPSLCIVIITAKTSSQGSHRSSCSSSIGPGASSTQMLSTNRHAGTILCLRLPRQVSSLISPNDVQSLSTLIIDLQFYKSSVRTRVAQDVIVCSSISGIKPAVALKERALPTSASQNTRPYRVICCFINSLSQNCSVDQDNNNRTFDSEIVVWVHSHKLGKRVNQGGGGIDALVVW